MISVRGLNAACLNVGIDPSIAYVMVAIAEIKCHFDSG